MLDDGTYDAIVIDAATGSSPDVLVVELTLVGGVHRGEMVTITATGLDRDPLDLLAVPATIVVTDGRPVLTLDD